MTSTRSGSRSPAARRRSTASTSGGVPASWTEVSPRRTSASSAETTASSSSTGPGGGMQARTRSCAASRRTPEGRPPGPRTIRPPLGSGVVAPTPAAARAAAFTQSAWPSTRESAAGRSGTARVSVPSEGNAPPGHRVWSQPLPRIHAPGGVVRARSAARPAQVTSSGASPSRTSRRHRPRSARWPWASASPGVAPPASTRAAPAPAAAAHADRLPTAANRPPRTRAASARGRAGLQVVMGATTRRSRTAGSCRGWRRGAGAAPHQVGRSASCVGTSGSMERPVSTAIRSASNRSCRRRTVWA